MLKDNKQPLNRGDPAERADPLLIARNPFAKREIVEIADPPVIPATPLIRTAASK